MIVSRTSHCASNAFAQISFRELLVWLGVYLKGSEEEKLKHIFDAFDQDGNKVLDHSEITNVLMVRATFPFSPLSIEWPARFAEAYRSCFTPVQVLRLSNKGKVSESEAIKKAADLVRQLDKDKDGQITLAVPRLSFLLLLPHPVPHALTHSHTTFQEWIEVGKETKLVYELLGDSFMQLMQNFNIEKS